ncbi:MAG: hypothetical protein KGS72_03815 [Cyanobacteria bacterium REEB67]|nr:hypothetical protein [Cyanobacteria bacterium REEB67]
MVKRSGNVSFDTMILNALKSMNRSKTLLFPAGTRAYAVGATEAFILDPSQNHGRPAVSGEWDLDCLSLTAPPLGPSMLLPEKHKIDWVNFDKLRLVR